MVQQRRVVRQLAHRGLELGDGLRRAALLVQHPAQRVAEGRGARLQRDGLADELLGLVELQAAVRQRVAEVVERGGVVGALGEQLAELGLGLLDLPLLLEDGRQLPACVPVLGLDGQDFPEKADRLVVVPEVVMPERQVVVDAVVLGPALARLLEALHRLADAAGLEQVVAQAQVQRRVVLERGGGAQELRRLRVLPAPLRVGGEPGGGRGVGGTLLAQLGEGLARLVHVAGEGLELADVRPELVLLGLHREHPAQLLDGGARVLEHLVDLAQQQPRGARLRVVEPDGAAQLLGRGLVLLLLRVELGQLVQGLGGLLRVVLEEALQDGAGALGVLRGEQLDEPERRVRRRGIELERRLQRLLGLAHLPLGPLHAAQRQLRLGVLGRELQAPPRPLLGALPVLHLQRQLRRLAGEERRLRVQRQRLLELRERLAVGAAPLQQRGAQVMPLRFLAARRLLGRGGGDGRGGEKDGEEGDAQADDYRKSGADLLWSKFPVHQDRTGSIRVELRTLPHHHRARRAVETDGPRVALGDFQRQLLGAAPPSFRDQRVP
jgi:hypothetical protein